jgi:hypothetical protein
MQVKNYKMTSSANLKHGDLIFLMLVSSGVLLETALNNFLVNFIISFLVAIVIHQKTNNKSSIHVMALIGYSIFIFAPALLNGFYFDTSFNLFYATSFLTYMLLRSAVNCEDKVFSGKKSIYIFLFICYSFFISVSSYLNIIVNYSYFMAPFVMLFILSLDPKNRALSIFIKLTFLISFWFYFQFGWSGFGRTVMFGNIMVAFLCAARIYDININKYLITSSCVIATTLLTTRKGFDLDGMRNLEFLNDSAFGPYRLAETFIQRYENAGVDFSGFFDQVIFTIFSFVPREVWESKPFGFGFVYVLENMDQYLVDSGHSIASTLFGDHVYYLGWWGLFTGMAMVSLLARIIVFVYSRKVFDGALYIILSCNMMVLLWGGMTSFSARVIFPMIGILLLYVVYLFYKSLFKRY